MNIKAIAKKSTAVQRSNLQDYQQAFSEFSWDAARDLLSDSSNGCINIAYEAVDRHVENGKANTIALRWIAKDSHREDFTYQDLSDLSSQFANVLTALGVVKGECVYTLLGRVPPL